MLRAFVAVATVIAMLLPAAASTPQLPLHISACTAGKSKLPAHCGTLRVYEDRAARSGRTIDLHFMVVDAVHPAHRAIFWNPGGPGGDDLSNVPFIADGLFGKEMHALHDTYDLVFVDNRGTGLSHQIQCDLYPMAHPEYYYKQIWPDALLRACRAQRAKDTNLSLYTTDISADDLDDVRAALHYPKVVLDGGSYGTMFFLDYARRHPSHVESLVLQGVAPPGVLIIPLEDAQGAQKAMTDLERDCANDRLCHSRFPDFAAHFNALVHRFDNGPIPVVIKNPKTKRLEPVSLSREVFDDRMRQGLYASEGAAFVPYVTEQAYRKNYVPLGRFIEVITDFLGRGQAIGLNLSVTCAEDIPFITEAKIAQTSAGSFQGDTRVRAQQHACAIWNVKPVSPSFAQPVRSNAPILMISGTEDPATPPQYALEALRYLPNGRQILIQHATHETELDCETALMVQFVRTRNAKALDAAHCAAGAHRPPFQTSMKALGG